MSWQIGPLPLQPHFVRGPPPPPLPLILVVCLRISTGFKGDSFRERHICENFGRTDKMALLACLQTLNVSGAFLKHSVSINRRRHMHLRNAVERQQTGTETTKQWLKSDSAYLGQSDPEELKNDSKVNLEAWKSRRKSLLLSLFWSFTSDIFLGWGSHGMHRSPVSHARTSLPY